MVTAPVAASCEMRSLLLDALESGGWTVVVDDHSSWWLAVRLVAVRGDLRAAVRWDYSGRLPFAARSSVSAELVLRDPAHDPGDFAQPDPKRWYYPATRDEGRRCPVYVLHSLARLLGRDGDTLSALILQTARARAVATAGR